MSTTHLAHRLDHLLQHCPAWLFCLAGLATLALVLLARKITLFYWRSHLNLPGPPAESFWTGSVRLLSSTPAGEPTAAWFDTYGPTILVRHSLCRPDVFTVDPSFMHHFLHSDAFTIGDAVRRFKDVLGLPHSVIAQEDSSEHQRLKRAMIPAFGAPVIRAMWPDVLDLATQLGDKVDAECMANADRRTLVSSTKYVANLTIDVLGKCGFGHDFGVISTGKPTELELIMGKILGNGPPGWLDYLAIAGLLPITVTKRQRNMQDAKRALIKMSREILQRRKAELLAEVSSERKREEFENKDVISMLLRANLASDTPPALRLTDDEVADQIPLLILAGNVTTVSTMVWLLHYLSVYPDVQAKLRAELQQVENPDPDYSEIEALPYLDATTKEVLRIYSAAVTHTRTVHKKTTIPLSQPVRGRNGKMMNSVRLDVGTTVRIPMPNAGTSKTLFGPDAHVFRPERHLEGDEFDEIRKIGVVWGNSLSFGGGERGCIGWRMAVLEIKALMFVFLRKFEVSQPEGLKLQRVGMITGTKNVVSGTKDADNIPMPIIFKLL